MTTPDPFPLFARVAWASRPTGPLSDLYATDQETDRILAWLADLLAKAGDHASITVQLDADGTLRYTTTGDQPTVLVQRAVLEAMLDELAVARLAATPLRLAAERLVADLRQMDAEGAIDLTCWPAAVDLITRLEHGA